MTKFIDNIGPKVYKNADSFSNSPPEVSGAAVAFSSDFSSEKNYCRKRELQLLKTHWSFASEKNSAIA